MDEIHLNDVNLLLNYKEVFILLLWSEILLLWCELLLCVVCASINLSICRMDI